MGWMTHDCNPSSSLQFSLFICIAFSFVKSIRHAPWDIPTTLLLLFISPFLNGESHVSFTLSSSSSSSSSPSPNLNRYAKGEDAMEADESQAFVDSIRRLKRPKTSATEEEKAIDRISALPDSLLIHILTLLDPKYAVKTHILSKRWRFLWTSIPVLHFKEKDPDKRWNRAHRNVENTKRFVSFINHALVLHQSSKIQKFAVEFQYMDTFASDVNVWLLFATQKYVKELQLDFLKISNLYNTVDTFYQLPLNVLNNSSLVTLTLGQCGIDRSGLISWKSLKVLNLSRMLLSNVLIQHILLATPSLETFELIHCEEYDCIDLKSSGLKRLYIEGYGRYFVDGFGDSLIISPPNLQSLQISGWLRLNKICVNDLSSVVDAILDFMIDCPNKKKNYEQCFVEYPKCVKELFKHLRHVKDLTVGSWCLQCLLESEGNALPSPLSTLSCLRITTKFNKWELPGITKLLALTPVLETLVISISKIGLFEICRDFLFGSYVDDVDSILERQDIDKKNYWLSRKTSFALALENLKTVKIVNFTGEERAIEFILFLLKNARQLEKMVIHTQKPATRRSEITLKNPLKVAQILSCPRCSPNVVIIFS